MSNAFNWKTSHSFSRMRHLHHLYQSLFIDCKNSKSAYALDSLVESFSSRFFSNVLPQIIVYVVASFLENLHVLFLMSPKYSYVSGPGPVISFKITLVLQLLAQRSLQNFYFCNNFCFAS